MRRRRRRPDELDVCLVGVRGPICANACQAVPTSEPAAAASSPGETRAWFADPAVRAYGSDPLPDSPPPC